jgi:hypothetical protein
MSQLLPIRLKINNGQAMIEYLIVVLVLAISTGIAVKLLGNAMSRYFGFLIAFVSLPIP